MESFHVQGKLEFKDFKKQGLSSEELRLIELWKVDKCQVSTVKRRRFERSAFFPTFRLDYEADVSSVSPSTSLSD